MTGISEIRGVAVPFGYSGVDTDAMFPVSGEAIAAEHGFGAALFARWRSDPDFILSKPVYAGARILVADTDFGIGSSGETAVWALKGAGFLAVLAPSFGDIFRSNCVRNGVLAAVIDPAARERVHAYLAARPGAELVADVVVLPAAAENHLPVTWCVLDDQALGSIRDLQEFRMHGRYLATSFEFQPDFAAIAAARGCYGETVTSPDQIGPALRRALAANTAGQPAVLGFRVAPNPYSVPGISGSMTVGRVAHSVSKGGVIAATRQLAAEGGRAGIRANVISPGMIATEGTAESLLRPGHPMTRIGAHIPLGRVGTAEEVVDVAVFLASDAAAYVTGANVVVDGGWSAVLNSPPLPDLEA